MREEQLLVLRYDEVLGRICRPGESLPSLHVDTLSSEEGELLPFGISWGFGRRGRERDATFCTHLELLCSR